MRAEDKPDAHVCSPKRPIAPGAGVGYTAQGETAGRRIHGKGGTDER